MTKRKLSAASMLAKISRCHSAVRGMSFQSTHASRFCTARASPSLRTKSLSLREYDMKTCAIPTKPPRFRRWVYHADAASSLDQTTLQTELKAICGAEFYHHAIDAGS